MHKKVISHIVATTLALGLLMTTAFAAELNATEADWNSVAKEVSSMAEISSAENTTFDETLAMEKLTLSSPLAIGDNSKYENESNDYYYQANILYDDYTVTGVVGGYDLDWYVFDLSSACTVMITAVGDRSGLMFGIFDRYGDDCLTATTAEYRSSGYYGGNITCNLPAGRYTLLFLSDYGYYIDYVFYSEFITPLSAPTITVSTETNTGKPYISWTQVTGALKYDVFCSSSQNGTYNLLHTSTSTSFVHTDARVGEDYYYKVRAVNGNDYSDYSSTKGVYCDLPCPTISVGTNASNGKPTISWTAVDGASGYAVYRSNAKNGDYTKLTTTAADKLSVTHTGAEVGQTYFYKVRAIYESNTSCNSAFSTAQGVWCDLARPTITVTNRASDGKPTISWTAVDGASGYAVYRSNTKDGTYAKLITVNDPNKLSVTHTGAKVGQTYFYKVCAIYESNTSCNSAFTEAQGVWCDLPQPATIVTNSASDGKPIISWTAVDGASGYAVYCSNTKNGDYTELTTTAADELSLTHADAEVGQTYFYKVCAVYESNTSCNSALTDAQGVWCDLSQPAVTVANRASDGKPTVSWTAVDGASGYAVYWSNTKNGDYTKLTTTAADKLSVTHTGAKVGQTYFYKVCAIYESNTSCNSAFSAAQGVWCDLARPTITVTNRASDGKPTISWTAVEGATGYEVYRCGTSAGTYVKMYTAKADKLSVTHTGAAVGNDYFYKVKAIYGDNSSCDSALTAAKGVWVDLKRPTIKVVNNASSGKPVISWDKVDYAVGYKVYCSTGSSTGTYKLIYSTDNPDKLSVTHTGAKAGEAYYYKVVAVHKNSKCTSAMSAYESTYCNLAQPTLTVELNSTGKPYLSWTESAGADSYQVYRSTDNSTWTLLYTAKGDDFDVTHTGAKADTTYYYKVVAICGTTSDGNSAYSTVQSITVE